MSNITMNGYGRTVADMRRQSLPTVVGRALASMEKSAQPAVVFSSLVQLCVPTICELARVTISGADGQVHAVSWPRDSVKQDEPRLAPVVVPFDAPATEDHEAFHGEATFGFATGDSAQPFIAQLVVDRAMATVDRERLLMSTARIQTVAQHLEVALASNREIGVAIGIVMATNGLTAGQAFDVLREVSQRSNTKLRTVALEVIRTGTIQLPVKHAAEAGVPVA
jgi:hypothetical protein